MIKMKVKLMTLMLMMVKVSMTVFMMTKVMTSAIVTLLSGFSKIALVIIENGTSCLVENFVPSRYNHRLVIIAMTAMAARFVDVSESQIFVFVLVSRIITRVILLKQLVTSGSVNIAIVTSTSSR